MAKSVFTMHQLEFMMTAVLAKTLPDILIKVLESFESSLDRVVDKLEAKRDALGKPIRQSGHKISKIDATRRLKCTKFDFRWDSPRPLSCI